MLTAIKRTLIVVLGVVLQFGFSISVQLLLNEYSVAVNLIYWLISVFIVLSIIKNHTRLSSILPGIIIIIIFPIFGTILFFTLGSSYRRSKLAKALIKKDREYGEYLKQGEKLSNVLEDNEMLRYFPNYSGYPVTQNNQIEYYEIGEKFYDSLLVELKKAEKFVFMEYFIINKGQMWDGILDILKEKAKSGVEVRIMYDDMGSVALLPENYSKELAKYNIKCIPFNHLSPFKGIMMNNRDHRKMTIIDGKVAFSGGVNISDEYINVTHPYGHWKDNGIKIVGEAIWNLTVMFLTLWNANENQDDDILKFKYDFSEENIGQNGYAVPYGNDPIKSDFVGEDVYLNIINSAKKYVYIYTPYLIIDTDMINSLVRAAKKGVDVRIVVPGIPDKKIVYTLSSSYFKLLISNGVKIYKYTPGFVHSKVFVADDTRAVVGTLNLDYRSLYLHFENGIYMEEVDTIPVIKKDLEDAFAISELLTKEKVKTGFFKSLWQAILRLFAPLM